MSNLENKLKKIIDTFNKENREIAFKDIKKLSEKYNNNISVQNVLFQIAKKVGDIDTSIIALKRMLNVRTGRSRDRSIDPPCGPICFPYVPEVLPKPPCWYSQACP